MPRWTAASIPNLAGRRAIITGATSGIGLESAIALAGAGAELIITGRNPQKGGTALASIRARHPKANVRFEIANMASLRSIREFAEREVAAPAQIDILMNNAGVFAVPQRRTTEDGFEMQFGVNYLGHFALTAFLVPALLRATAPRVVTISSLAHQQARIDFDNLQSERQYSPLVAYGQSKLADLIFALELQRRAHEARSRLASTAAHPGLATTNIVTNVENRTASLAWNFFGPLVAQSAAHGALPGLYAATSADARPGGYYGPDGFREYWGYPAPARIAPQAEDRASAERLWRMSEQVTVPFPALG